MTSQTGKNRHVWRRTVTCAVASSALAVGLLMGVASPTALAQPEDPTTESDAPPTPTMTADEALAIIARDYDMGAGGGQLSNLIDEVLKLRALGFKPSNGNKLAIQEALDKRPNQGPLVEALQETLAYQRKLQAQAANAVASSPAVIGTTPLPPGVPPDPGNPNNTGIGVIPGGSTINQPIG